MTHSSWLFQNSLYISNLDVAYFPKMAYVYIYATCYSYNVTNTPFTKKGDCFFLLNLDGELASALTNSVCQK